MQTQKWQRLRRRLQPAALRYSRQRLASPIVFSTSLEGSVIKMKPTTLASQDTTVSLKA